MLRAGYQPHASTPFSLLTPKGSGSGIVKFILSGYIFSLCCYQSVPWDGFGLDDQKPFVVCQPGHGVIMVRHKKHAQHLRTCCTFRTGSLPSSWSSTLTLETHMRNLSQWECLLVLLLCLCRQKSEGDGGQHQQSLCLDRTYPSYLLRPSCMFGTTTGATLVFACWWSYPKTFLFL